MDSRIGLYADDTALFYCGNSIEDVMTTLQREMSIVGEWLRANKLSLNVKKTKFVIFGSLYKTAHLPDVTLTVFGSRIERVHEIKYLGVILDQNLNFNSHIDFIVKKSSQKLGALAMVRKCINRPTSLMLYKSMILPHFDYCSIVYMNTSQANL